MEKAFDPHSVEPRWRDIWRDLNIGVADASSAKPSFTIALPPPNITGRLHLGHACGSSIQDALSRYHRMCGDEVEWTPGTDHAAIATNAVIERQLAAEGTSKEELGRPLFHARVDAWYEEYGGHILGQMRSLGFSCDWSRTRFTMDPAYETAIRVVFKQLYEEGLIYRGPRIVNWCPHDRSAISDEEVDWQEHTAQLTHLRYPVEGGGSVVVATVRPETMLGDTAVAVAPGDARFADLVGKFVVLPLTNRRIPIIEDSAVRPEFGAGALKVTPGHDPTDYEIGQRHGLPTITVIAPDGTMDFPDLPSIHGMPADDAREAVTAQLRELGVVVKEEEYVHEVGHCDRCGHVLEPLVSAQWWVAMKSLAAPGIDVVECGEVRFHPQRYTDVYLSWMRNIRDWCISRQLWLGHRIPVSTCANGHTFAWIDEPTACAECASTELIADPDVLDTWFSSALWPFAIYGWPEKTEDLERFYPTNVLATSREIIFLWVARMIMTGIKFAGGIPFTDVIITSTIQAKNGSRMSKSKGNAVDPQEMIERYGADAVRAWAGAVGTSGQDVRFDEDRIESFQRFANKIWNSTRFLASRLGSDGETIEVPQDVALESLLPEDRWILARTAETVDVVTASLHNFRFHDAMDRIYATFWNSYCSWYIEAIKSRLADDAPEASRRAAAWTAATCLDTLLRALHPFMPFITEECAQHIAGAAPTLQQREWPVIPQAWRTSTDDLDAVIEFVQAVRAVRQEAGARGSWKQRDDLEISGSVAGISDAEVSRILEALDPVSVVTTAPEASRALRVVSGAFNATLHLAASVDHEDADRLRRQLGDVQKRVEQLNAQLANEKFTARAKPEVVAEARRRLAESEAQAETLRQLVGGAV